MEQNELTAEMHNKILAAARYDEETKILDRAKLPISTLSDRELLEEQTYLMRAVWSMVSEFQAGGMGKMVASMLPSLLAPKK